MRIFHLYCTCVSPISRPSYAGRRRNTWSLHDIINPYSGPRSRPILRVALLTFFSPPHYYYADACHARRVIHAGKDPRPSSRGNRASFRLRKLRFRMSRGGDYAANRASILPICTSRRENTRRGIQIAEDATVYFFKVLFFFSNFILRLERFDHYHIVSIDKIFFCVFCIFTSIFNT